MVRDNIGKEIYNKFGSEKIIVGVKNDNTIKIKFIKTFLWAIPLIVTMGILLNLGNFYKILTEREMIILLPIFIVAIISTITIVGTQSYKLYIKNNFLILENYFRMKKYIDINKYPRIYIRQHIYEEYRGEGAFTSRRLRTIEKYYLYIEQNDILIKIKVNINGVNELLDNLILKNKEECNEKEWNFSVNNKEKKMFEYMQFLNTQVRIVGVKDKSKNIRINKNETLLLYILIIVFLFLMSMESFLLLVEAYLASIFMLFGIILNIGTLIVKNSSNKIKVSYIDDVIKIDKYKLKYKENNIRLEMIAMQFPTFKEKYKYDLRILGEKNTYSIPLGNVKENEIGEFINNLIFE